MWIKAFVWAYKGTWERADRITVLLVLCCVFIYLLQSLLTTIRSFDLHFRDESVNMSHLALYWHVTKQCSRTECDTQHKKASNHHANLPLEMYSFCSVTTWETPGNHWCWWPDTLIIARALARSVRSSAPVVSRCFPGGYTVKLYISKGRLAWWLLAFLHSYNYCDTAELQKTQ